MSAKAGTRQLRSCGFTMWPCVMDHVLDQRPAVAHGDRAVELAAALHRVDRPADVGGMHAVQDADLAGHPVHREPHALHVEGDGARRQVGLAARP